MLFDYIPVFILIIIALGFAVAALVTSLVLGKRGRSTAAKNIAYECGKDPMQIGSPRFSVKFYLVAMLFILFDIEVVFLYAWAVVYRQELTHGFQIFISMFSFLGILLIGYIYALKKKAFDWSN